MANEVDPREAPGDYIGKTDRAERASDYVEDLKRRLVSSAGPQVGRGEVYECGMCGGRHGAEDAGRRCVDPSCPGRVGTTPVSGVQGKTSG